jgi:hypothetical protein
MGRFHMGLLWLINESHILVDVVLDVIFRFPNKSIVVTTIDDIILLE